MASQWESVIYIRHLSLRADRQTDKYTNRQIHRQVDTEKKACEQLYVQTEVQTHYIQTQKETGIKESPIK